MSDRILRLPSAGVGSLAGGGEPPQGSGMEAIKVRLSAVESKVDKLDDRLRVLERGISAIEAKLDLLVAKVPSWWQPPLGVVAVLGAIGALVALLKLLKVIV